MSGPGDRAHAAVVGAGIVGICTALLLRRRGFDVTLLDPEAPGSQTSSGNAGGFGVSEVLPLSMPGVLWKVPRWLLDPLGPLAIRWTYLPRLLPWLARFVAAGRGANVARQVQALTALMQTTFDDYMPLLRDAGVAGSVISNGALTVYRHHGAFLRDADDWRTRRAHGVRCEELSGAEVRELEPDLAPDVCCGMFTPDWRHTLDPHRLACSLADLYRREGGALQQGRVLAIRPEQHGHQLRLEDGAEFRCSHVVVAAGVWSKPFVRQLDRIAVPLESERGYNTTLPSPGVQLDREVIFAEQKFVATPMAMGLRVGGAAEFAGLSAPPDYRRCDALLRLAKAFLPALRTDGGSQWMGHRPSTPDSLPVIGRSPRHATVYYAFGHGHLGLTQAATTGRLIAQLACGEPASIDIAPFRVDRF